MPDRFTSLQVFVKVAALGGLSPAARALRMSQTMATKHLDALEERLGTKLVHRTTRRLTLTDAGRNYLERAERIIAEWEEADALAMSERIDVKGMLRVNAPLSFGFREIAPLLAEFAQLHPHLTIDLGLNDRLVDLIEEGWDLAIRIGQMRSSTMIARKLAPCRLVVAAAPAYLAANGTPRTTAELAQHNCLGYTLSNALGPDQWTFGTDEQIDVAIHGNLRASNGDALVRAAVCGQGIIYEPSFLVADALRTGELVALALDHPPIEFPGIYAVYPAARHPPAKVRAFVDFLSHKFGHNPPWERELDIPRAEPRRNR